LIPAAPLFRAYPPADLERREVGDQIVQLRRGEVARLPVRVASTAVADAVQRERFEVFYDDLRLEVWSDG
jgi:hypothetical protein